MKTVNNKQFATQLGRKLDQATAALEDALNWVSQQRQNVPRLEIEADRLTIKLRRLKKQSQHYSAASRQACAVGFFGFAQKGKEYLINALMSGDNRRLTLNFGGQLLDYTDQLNPSQHTATLAQRFTRQPPEGDAQWSVHLCLLNESDIVSMLAAVWHQRPPQSSFPSAEQLDERIKNLLAYQQNEAVLGITAEDMILLCDRCNRTRYPAREALIDRFWPLAIELAPRLEIDNRAQLFSLLWGEDSELTALYRQLAHLLHHLGNVRQVAAQPDSINDASCSLLNIYALRNFNTREDVMMQVCPHHQGRLLKPVTLSLSELIIISREIVLPLNAVPRKEAFNEVDAIDFPAPGVRDPHSDLINPLALEIIQAKRGLLLSLASEEQQMHWLMICTANTMRKANRTSAALLDFWVRQTQGEDNDTRRQRKPGLIWTLTPFDDRITAGENLDTAVQRHVGMPGDSWDSMLVMDDKDLQRMTSWLTGEVRRETKLARLSEQYHELYREFQKNLLEPWSQQDSASDPSAKQQIARSLLETLQTRTGIHGELLERLLPERDALRQLFLQLSQRGMSTLHKPHALQYNDPFSIGVTIDLLKDQKECSDATSDTALSERDSAASAHQVYRYWVNLLRQVPDNTSLKELLGIPKPTLEILIEELITGSIRLKIEDRLIKALSEITSDDPPAGQVAQRKAAQVLSVLGDYIAWLGFQSLPDGQKPDSRIHPGQKIFARPVVSEVVTRPGKRLSRLSAAPVNSAAYYVYDWLVALNAFIVQNAGLSAAQDISDEARQSLASIASRVVT